MSPQLRLNFYAERNTPNRDNLRIQNPHKPNRGPSETASRAGHSSPSDDLLHMKSYPELRKIALPILARQQAPMDGVTWAIGMSLLTMAILAVLSRCMAHYTGTIPLLAGVGGALFGVIAGGAFNRKGRTFQTRFTRCAGLIAAAAWVVFFLVFTALLPDGQAYQIVGVRAISGGRIGVDVSPLAPANLVLVVDILLAYWTGAVLARHKFSRNELYQAARETMESEPDV